MLFILLISTSSDLDREQRPKGYFRSSEDTSPRSWYHRSGGVVFISGENLFAAALEHDKTHRRCRTQRAVIVTLDAHALAYGWRREESDNSTSQLIH